MISIVTPFLNHSELIPMFAHSTTGAQVIIVDNGSEPEHAEKLQAFCKLAGERAIYIRNETNRGFSAANNQGLAVATGEIVVFMNNDVECRPGWLDQVARDVQPGILCGPSLLIKHGWRYLEGYCIAAHRGVWGALGGWEEHYYTGLYWEDNDLCARAVHAGFELVKTTWPVWHFNNYTSRGMPGADSHSKDNERKFLERVAAWHHSN
jgi:GT2 family glycosyltransferase